VKLVIDEIVVAETVWVLKSFYGYPNQDIARIVWKLLSHESLEADDKPGLLAALSLSKLFKISVKKEKFDQKK
jgi:predicted nucleic-acid-binding protein